MSLRLKKESLSTPLSVGFAHQYEYYRLSGVAHPIRDITRLLNR